MVDHERLAGVLVDFARNLVSEYDTDELLDTLCREAVVILGVSGAGVMLADEHGDLRFVAASDETVRAIEALQIEIGEGPCLAAYETGKPVVERDLEDVTQFHRFAPRALAAGLRGVYSFPMCVVASEDQIGALNLYTAGPGTFGDDAQATGQILADVATTYILNARALARSARVTGQLQHALSSRVVIEQAKGRLSAQLGTTIPDAFERMRRYARGHRVKIHDVAAMIVQDRLPLGDL